jgi:hypothetical protein
VKEKKRERERGGERRIIRSCGGMDRSDVACTSMPTLGAGF